MKTVEQINRHCLKLKIMKGTQGQMFINILIQHFSLK